MAKRKAVSFTRAPGGEPVEVDDDGAVTYPDGVVQERHEGPVPEGTKEAVSYERGPNGEVVQVSPDGKTTYFSDGMKWTRS